MKIFNKVVVIIVLICLAFICLLAIVNAFAGYINWSDTALRVLGPVDEANPYIVTLALLFIFIVCIFLLILEFYPRKIRAASISSSKSGFAMITLDTIGTQIKNSVKKLEGLEDIKVKISPKTGGIIINMWAKLSEDQDIPQKMQEIVREATSVASEKLGIKVIKANLTIVGLTPQKAGEDREETEAGKEIIETAPEQVQPETDEIPGNEDEK